VVYVGHLAHFGHANIIKYCNRPFANVTEMDNTIIHNWNSVVQPEDIVYHLGDFAVGGGPAIDYLRRLNGRLIFCWGNHDNRLKSVIEATPHPVQPVSVEHLREISVDGQRLVLCHYAMRVWHKSHKGAWHLYGHSHGTLPDDPNALSLDVGVDCWNYFPVSMDQLRARMKKKTFKPVDHHGEHTT
jgi:calcineurin-like phosphoesterase family protein